jgi:2-(1,2-epoxy-1,2-dihydrophenyl)acetyl-CoA isomerase
MSSPILVNISEGVQTITLNRPDKLNSFNPDMHAQLRAALQSAAIDPQIRAVLLTGNGRGFCAGQDLSEREAKPGDTPRDLATTIETFYNPLVRLMRGMEKPIVCAVNGIAAGAGANIALAADIVLAGRSAGVCQNRLDPRFGWHMVFTALGGHRTRHGLGHACRKITR